jgi:diguanylate cyclase (GGDEF)-like protein
MTETTADSSQPGSEAPVAAFRERMRRLDRRLWWLWSSAILTLILMTLGVASLAFPALLAKEQTTYSFYLNQAVRALVGVVLVFAVYLVYQQSLIMRLRNQLAEQIESLAKVESLANEIYKLAALDQLTGLYNRRSGEQRLELEISRSMRHGRPLTILLLDLDGLKRINDRFGHAAGDCMLQSFSERLQKAIRASDLAVRLGGDEFMVLLPECRAEEVRHVLGRLDGLTVVFDDETIPCQYSSGWTDYQPTETPQEFIKRADEALYANKRAGRRADAPSPRAPTVQPVS